MDNWHKTYTDPLIGGLNVGVMGAMKYVLGAPNGNAITKGYHKLYMNKGTLMGEIGALHGCVYYLKDGEHWTDDNDDIDEYFLGESMTYYTENPPAPPYFKPLLARFINWLADHI